MLPVRLDQQTVANLEVGDGLADLHDADDRLVAGSHRLLIRVVRRNVLQRIQVDTRHDVGLARVAIELVEQLRIGEQMPQASTSRRICVGPTGSTGFAGLTTNSSLPTIWMAYWVEGTWVMTDSFTGKTMEGTGGTRPGRPRRGP